MTEAEWLACTDPEAMLDVLPAKTGYRKLRLFIVSCCRRVWHTFEEEDDGEDRRAAIELAERYADGLADDDELVCMFDDLTDGEPHRAGDCCTNLAVATFTDHTDAVACAVLAAQEAGTDAAYDDWCKTDDRERYNAIERAEFAAQAAMLRCFFNPFRRVKVKAAWRTPTVVSLAQAAYDERLLPSGEMEPARLAVLADALLDAGCDDDALMAHLREPGPHRRGCYVVDGILGKK